MPSSGPLVCVSSVEQLTLLRPRAISCAPTGNPSLDTLHGMLNSGTPSRLGGDVNARAATDAPAPPLAPPAIRVRSHG
jgi:hypothetical protein